MPVLGRSAAEAAKAQASTTFHRCTGLQMGSKIGQLE